MRHHIKNTLFFLILSVLVSNSFAYEANSQSATMTLLPKNWTIRQMDQTDISKTLEFKNVAVKPPAYELIIHSTILKMQNADAMQNVNGLFGSLKEGFQGKCAVQKLNSVPNKDHLPFNEWVSYFQCESTHMVGMILIVDADPKSIYLFTYHMTNALPHDNMLKNLTEMIKICYKKNVNDNDCYFLAK